MGTTVDRTVDVRIVAATNVDPERAMRAGRLRPDLWYRLAKLTLRLPPLRERREDIPALIAGWCASKAPAPVVEPAAVEVLCGRRWPGNVRELLGVLEAAWIERDGSVIRASDVRGPADRARGDEAIARRMASAYARAGKQRPAARALGWSWGRWWREKERLGLVFDPAPRR